MTGWKDSRFAEEREKEAEPIRKPFSNGVRRDFIEFFIFLNVMLCVIF